MPKFACCFLAAVPMRAMPSHKAEMVNQLLEGDTVELLEESGEWLRVRCCYDGYEGWVSRLQLRPCPPAAAKSQLSTPNSQLPADPVAIAEEFLGTPYLWGGRTRMGIDCSGLMQLAFKDCGIWLPRDASQQAGCGEEVAFNDVRRGDLLFFQNVKGRIVHVGVATGDGHIVHASGWVRRDKVDATGIINGDGERTHTFALARRVKK